MREGRFRRAYVGIGAGERPLPPKLARELGRDRCVEVVEVVADGPAARAGIRPGDLLLAVDAEPVLSMNELQRLLIGERIGAPARFSVARDEHRLELTIVPVELPS
jgi:S1-C subfamily serine protease